MKTNKPKASVKHLLFATGIGLSIWVASHNLVIGLCLATITTGVCIAIKRGDWL